MKLKPYLMLALLWAVAQGVWAETSVTIVNSEEQLTAAIADGANIQLGADIPLSSYLYIAQSTVTIDLNGHKLSRSLSDYSIYGSVIEVDRNGALILKSSAEGGSIEGGWAVFGGGIRVLTGCSLSVTGVTFTNNIASESGGAIFVQSGANVTLSNARFISNSANDHAGAIWNNGTLSAADCTFESNTAKDVGAIYNSATVDGEGTATLTRCTFTGNKGTTGAGALANALGNTVMTIENCTITGNIASGHGGGIWNGGTLTATNSAFTNNIANDVGGIYNATDGTTAGTAALKGCTFTGNKGTAGAGALANAMGNTVMTIEDCTIQDNTAYEYGAGIWNGGTLNMKGAVKVTGNKNDDNAVSNVWLKTEKVITLTGALSSGSSIGVDLESVAGTFTSGYSNYQHGSGPFFTADRSSIVGLGFDDDGEACLIPNDITPVTYIERSWDDTKKEVISTERSLRNFLIGYDATPVEGQYKEVTNAPTSTPDEWFRMGGYSTSVAEFYVVREDVNRETIVVQGSNVHLILCDGVTLTLTGGLKLEGDNKLYIHSQSYGDNMGQLIVTNSFDNAAGIGSAWHNDDAVKVGELVIYGGHIEATGGDYGAGIGSCRKYGDNRQLCNKVTVYGGYVKAQGGEHAAGIGGGAEAHGGDFILYDGTVIANGGDGKLYIMTGDATLIGKTADAGGGAGVGGGGVTSYKTGHHAGLGGDVTIYGGTLTATANSFAAAIGSGSSYGHTDLKNQLSGGTFTMYGGTVTASAEDGGAGIGGGCQNGGAKVYVSGGTVTATSNYIGAGIGGSSLAYGGEVTITGGTVTAICSEWGGAGIGGGDGGDGAMVIITGGSVTAIGGEDAAGIGGGKKGDGGSVSITGGNVIAKAGEQGENGCRAIGPGTDSFDYGALVIGNVMMVGAGNDGSVERIFDADERVNGCWFRSYAEISPCTHLGAFYTVNGTNADDTHTIICNHCSKSFEPEKHTLGDNQKCSVCGVEDLTYDVTYYVPDLRAGNGYIPIPYQMVPGSKLSLPGNVATPTGLEFAGWLENASPLPSNYLTSDGETLLKGGEIYTISSNVNIVARYRNLVISLADDSDNSETLYKYNGKKAASVILTRRKLYKDGSWNTLCLPFEVSTTSEPLSGDGVVAMTLDTETSGFSNGTLTLNFTDVEGTIPAGTPFIIKWTNDDNNPTIVDPTFTNVTISKELIDQTCTINDEMSITFKGTYGPVSFDEEGDNSVLYLGADNTLYYPSGAMTINAQRAFFQLEGLTAGETSGKNGIKAFELNFGEETGIRVMEDGRGKMDDAWFSIDGRKLMQKPTAKGIYIGIGKKMIIK